MKNFMKKTAFAALAALMALSAVSCGKTADGDGAEVGKHVIAVFFRARFAVKIDAEYG